MNCVYRCYRKSGQSKRYCFKNGDWLAKSIDRYDQITHIFIQLEWYEL